MPALVVVVSILLAACSTPEDTGARLKRECESIVRESASDDVKSNEYLLEQAVKNCIYRRGVAEGK